MRTRAGLLWSGLAVPRSRLAVPRAAVTVLALAGFGVAACGSAAGTGHQASPSTDHSVRPSAEPSGARLVPSMQAAVRGAQSVHVDGNVIEHGKPLGLNLGVTRQGAYAGSVTSGSVPLLVIGIGDRFYFKATATVLRLLGAPAAACAVVCGKYLETKGAQTRREVGEVSMATLTSDLTSNLPRMTEDGTTTVRGKRAWVLAGANGATVKVAITGPHYPLEVDSPPSKHGVVFFSDWNRIASPKPPPAGEIYRGPGAP
jgi:hypothetical protein